MAGDFPDGQVFVDLGCQTSIGPNEVLARVLRTLGVAPVDVPHGIDERVGRFRSLTAGRRLLLVVDGVTGAAQVRPLLPAGPGPAVIVVGQRYLGSLDRVRQVAVRPLDRVGAGDLLAAFAGADRLAVDPAASGGAGPAVWRFGAGAAGCRCEVGEVAWDAGGRPRRPPR